MDKTKCYLCEYDGLVVIRSKIRHELKRKVYRCKKCSLVFLEPRQQLVAYYKKKIYRKKYGPLIGKSSSPEQIFNIYYPLKKYQVADLKKILTSKTKLLDIGCSSGAFLAAVKPYVKECVGIELNRSEANFAIKKRGLKVFAKNLDDAELPKNYFDVITAFEVLEHIEDPISFLDKFKKYLKPEGIVCIEVPNVNDWLLSVFDVPAYRDFYYREPHLFYYSPKTLYRMLSKAGYTGKVYGSSFSTNFVNQVNWILTQKPQESATMAYGDPQYPFLKVSETKKDVAEFLKEVDNLYRKFTRNKLLGRSIIFIGKCK